MQIEAGLPSSVNPFAAMMTPELLCGAHARLTGRVASQVHRPLDKPLIRKLVRDDLAAFDDAIDAETLSDFISLDD